MGKKLVLEITMEKAESIHNAQRAAFAFWKRKHHRAGRCVCGLKFTNENPIQGKECSEPYIQAPIIERRGEQQIA